MPGTPEGLALLAAADPKVKATVDIAKRAWLARAVFDAVENSVDSFELDDMVGPDLAYLMGAILRSSPGPLGQGVCSWPEDREIIRILRENFGTAHPVWQHVEIEAEEDV
jgi:hypothetical protein